MLLSSDAYKQPKSTTETTDKTNDLAKNTTDAADQFLTTNQGLKINDDQNSLKAGERRLINEEGKATFVKFHWKPKPGFAD